MFVGIWLLIALNTIEQLLPGDPLWLLHEVLYVLSMVLDFSWILPFNPYDSYIFLLYLIYFSDLDLITMLCIYFYNYRYDLEILLIITTMRHVSSINCNDGCGLPHIHAFPDFIHACILILCCFTLL